MAVRFKVDGATGRAAIYEATDDAPFTAPRSNLSRVHFHTDFDYIGIESATPTISTTVTTTGSLAIYDKQWTLGAHGKSGVPFVIAEVYAFGVWQPLVGAVPFWTNVSSSVGNIATVTLTIDSTNVYLLEQRSANGNALFGSIDIPVKVYVTDYIFT